MAVSVSVRHDIARATRGLDRISKRQIPFAVRRALNDTAFDGRKAVVEVIYPHSFQVRSKSLARAAFRVDKARRGQRPVARVFDRLDRAFLKKQAEAGVQKPLHGNWAIPTRYVRERRTTTGRVPKRLQPRQAKVYRTVDTLWRDFVRKADEALYTLRPTVRIPLRFRFFTALERLTRKQFPANLRRALARALATAR